MALEPSEPWPAPHCKASVQNLPQAPRQVLGRLPHRRITMCPLVPSLPDGATELSFRLFCLHRFTFHLDPLRNGNIKGRRSHEPLLVQRCNVNRRCSSPSGCAPILGACGGTQPLHLPTSPASATLPLPQGLILAEVSMAKLFKTERVGLMGMV